MARVSERLRAVREGAGLGIEDISARTKIKGSFLQAIERGEFERLPGEFFTRAFLRTYARELGLSPDRIVAEYDAERAPLEPVAEVVGTRVPGARDAGRPADQQRRDPRATRLPDEDSEAGLGLSLPILRSVWPVIALAAALLLVIYLVRQPAAADTSEPGAVGTGGVAAAPEAAPLAAAPSDPDRQKLTVELRASTDVWVTATADGKRALYRILQPGERVALEARQGVSMRIGNAGAIDYSINGAPAKALGAPGAVRDLEITHDNYRSFLR